MKKILIMIMLILTSFTLVSCDAFKKKPEIKDDEVEDISPDEDKSEEDGEDSEDEKDEENNVFIQDLKSNILTSEDIYIFSFDVKGFDSFRIESNSKYSGGTPIYLTGFFIDGIELSIFENEIFNQSSSSNKITDKINFDLNEDLVEADVAGFYKSTPNFLKGTDIQTFALWGNNSVRSLFKINTTDVEEITIKILVSTQSQLNAIENILITLEKEDNR